MNNLDDLCEKYVNKERELDKFEGDLWKNPHEDQVNTRRKMEQELSTIGKQIYDIIGDKIYKMKNGRYIMYKMYILEEYK